jgi:hypothetical protein
VAGFFTALSIHVAQVGESVVVGRAELYIAGFLPEMNRSERTAADNRKDGARDTRISATEPPRWHRPRAGATERPSFDYRVALACASAALGAEPSLLKYSLT